MPPPRPCRRRKPHDARPTAMLRRDSFFTLGSSTASTTMSHPANNAQAERPSRARCSSRRMTDGFSSRKTAPSASTFGNPKCRGKNAGGSNWTTPPHPGPQSRNPEYPSGPKRRHSWSLTRPLRPCRCAPTPTPCTVPPQDAPSNTASQPITPSAILHLIHNIPHNGTPAERPPPPQSPPASTVLPLPYADLPQAYASSRGSHDLHTGWYPCASMAAII